MARNCPVWFAVLVWMMTKPATAFMPDEYVALTSPGTRPHTVITERAIFRATATLLNEMAAPNRPISNPDDVNLSPSKMFSAFYGRSVSTVAYVGAVETIVHSSADVDLNDATKNDPTWHFDAEMIERANGNIIRKRTQLYNAAGRGDYVLARQLAGSIFHVLQDFYSHTNWLELGNKEPYYALGTGALNMSIADKDTATCRDCIQDASAMSYTCSDNMETSLKTSNVLTSGYHSGQVIDGKAVEKPPNKCSHGGMSDESSHTSAAGGINKDAHSNFFSYISPHAGLHREARRIAEDATVYFLKGLRESLGLKQFTKFLNVDMGRSLTIVMDTTGSMGSYIQAAKDRCFQLINSSKTDVNMAIRNYVLIPFNDPSVGPVFKTTDPEEFERAISNLQPNGGGDYEEMALGGLLLASRTSEEKSAIFLFTDAPPKDTILFQTVVSTLLGRQQSVSFFGSFELFSPRSSRSRPLQRRSRRGVDDLSMYQQISRLTGGQVITTSSATDNIFNATAWMTDSIKTSSVSLLKLEGMVDLRRTVLFSVDSTLESVEILVGHNVLAPTIQFPAYLLRNEYQVVIDSPTMSMYRFIQPQPELSWTFNVTSQHRDWYAEVRGLSSLDVVYSFAYLETASGTSHPGYRLVEGNPAQGDNRTLFVTSTCDDCTISKVGLRNASGFVETGYDLLKTDVPNKFRTDTLIPFAPYALEFTGTDDRGFQFQRLSSTQVVPTSLRITVPGGNLMAIEMLPSTTKEFRIIVTNTGRRQSVRVLAQDSLTYITKIIPDGNFMLDTNEAVNVTVTVKVPAAAQPYDTSDVEITVGAADGSYNVNYVRTKILVLSEVTDTVSPVCYVVASTLNSICERTTVDMCSAQQWFAEMDVSDIGTGIAAIFATPAAVEAGNVTWLASPANYTSIINTTVRINASGPCCVQGVTFSVVDFAGHTGRCQLQRPAIWVKSASSGLSEGDIAAIIVGTIVALLVFAAGSWYLFLRFRLRKLKSSDDDLPMQEKVQVYSVHL